jgi:hypothetical protein
LIPCHSGNTFARDGANHILYFWSIDYESD